jgi:hypothetical protein
MGHLFQTVVVAVTAVGIVLSFTRELWPFRAAREIGRVGASWFSREEDLPIDERPDASENDPPIPRRRLRPRL